ERQKQAKNPSAAENGDRAVSDNQRCNRLFKRRAGGIPQKRVWQRPAGRNGSNLPRHNDSFALVRPRPALVRAASVHEHGGAVQLALKKSLVGVIANCSRYHAVAVGDHAVGGHDGVTLDAVRSDQSLGSPAIVPIWTLWSERD